MTPEELAEAHTTVIRKHYRKLEDHPGRVHAELLADLAAIAEQHATEAVGEVVAERRVTSSATVARRKPRTTDQTTDRSPIA